MSTKPCAPAHERKKLGNNFELAIAVAIGVFGSTADRHLPGGVLGRWWKSRH